MARESGTRHLTTHTAGMLIAGVLAVVLAACSTDEVSGMAVKEPVPAGSEGAVVALMDTGNYSTAPIGPVGPAGANRDTQGLVEAQRMAEFVIGPWVQNSSMVGIGDLIMDSKGTQPLSGPSNLTFSQVVSDEQAAVAMAHGFIAGMSTKRVSTKTRGEKLQNAVLRFPDAAAAASATGEMAAKRNLAADVSPTPTSIRDHPEALAITWTAADSQFVQSFAAYGPFVLYQLAGLPLNDNYRSVENMVVNTIDKQQRALDLFEPTEPAKLAELPVDFTGHLLANALRAPDEKAPYMVGAWAPGAWLHFEDDPLKSRTWFSAAGVEAVAQWTTTVYETKTAEGAASLADEIAADLDDRAGVGAISGVPGLLSARCFRRTTELVPETAAQSLQRIGWRFKCVARADRYAFTAFSANETDVKQQISAQYRILAGE